MQDRRFRPNSDRIGNSFLPGQGFMKGFIDLVFNPRGDSSSWDWKSNFLGNRAETTIAGG